MYCQTLGTYSPSKNKPTIFYSKMRNYDFFCTKSQLKLVLLKPKRTPVPWAFPSPVSLISKQLTNKMLRSVPNHSKFNCEPLRIRCICPEVTRTPDLQTLHFIFWLVRCVCFYAPVSNESEIIINCQRIPDESKSYCPLSLLQPLSVHEN